VNRVPDHHTRPVLAAAAAFALLAVVHTWPLASDPAHWSRIDNGDAALNIWALDWVAYHLPRDPWHLADANIFYPERMTLAYSEMMLVQGVIAIPVSAAGGSPVLAYSIVLLAGFALTGWAFCLLAWRWTGSWTAGYVAGSLAAFNAHTLVRMTHLQALHAEFFAVMLFALDRLVVSRQFRDVWWLATGFVLQGLTSIYLLVFSVWMLLFAAAARAGEWLRGGAAGMLARVAAAGGFAVILLSPYLATYYRLQASMGFTRAADDEASADLMNYLATGSRLYYDWWSKPYFEASASTSFPGIMAVALVAAALSQKEHRRDPRVRMAAIAALGCLLVSFAPKLPFYPVLHRVIPLFQAIRVPAHLGQVVLLMIAVLAGFGVAGLQRRWGHARAWPAVALAIFVIVNVEALRAPVGFTWFDGVPVIYDALAREKRAVVVEMPFPAPRQWFRNGRYMVYSTRHRQSILNGYSGFRPPSYFESYDATRGFPSDTSLASLYARGVTHIVVHHGAFAAEFGETTFRSLESIHSLEPVASDEDTTIYRLLTH
jgi:hypothetical protein